MQKRLFIPLAIGLVALGVCLVLLQREPIHQGKRLSNWVDQFGTNHFSRNRGGPADKEAANAIREIGTNALPLLLNWVNPRESRLKRRMADLLPKQWVSRLNLGPVDFGQIRTRGAYGFVALGQLAKPSVPALMLLATNTDSEVRWAAVYSLGHLEAAAQPAIPLLIKCLDDPSGAVRIDAMHGLASIRLEPELVIPVLMKAIIDARRDQAVRVVGIQALGLYGAKAKAAVPVLMQLLNDPDDSIRSSVTTYLPMIDSEAARGTK